MRDGAVLRHGDTNTVCVIGVADLLPQGERRRMSRDVGVSGGRNVSCVNTIGRQDVAYLARLARVAVSDAELDELAGQLDVILHAVARVSEVAAADVPPMTHAVPVTNVLRRDEVRPSLRRDEVLAAAPAAEVGRFRVPRILQEEQ
jgi:aspartyl-tRNA(Asn)/glutamyl-tRNA(Gln) amidotransferase subunit C